MISKLHLSTVHSSWSPLYFYWQIIAWKFSDHVDISRVGMIFSRVRGCPPYASGHASK